MNKTPSTCSLTVTLCHPANAGDIPVINECVHVLIVGSQILTSSLVFYSKAGLPRGKGGSRLVARPPGSTERVCVTLSRPPQLIAAILDDARDSTRRATEASQKRAQS